MAQLLLDIQIDKKKELTNSERLKILFGETKDVLLPFMQQHISKEVFSSEHYSTYSETIKKHMLYLLNNKQYFERATYVGMGIVSTGTAWEPYANVLIGEEFLYISQMILDDIVDKQRTRMNQRTINDLIGNEKAIAIAEIFEAEGYRLIQRGIADIPVCSQLKIMSKTFEMMKNIYYAQFIDIDNTKATIDQIDINGYLHFLRFTTSSDIANCFHIGSMIGGAEAEVASMFHDLGLCIGMLMQIKDDFIDFLTEDMAHKDILLDVRNSQKRIPIILAYHLSEETHEKDFLNSVLGKSDLDDDEKQTMRQIILSDKVMSEARKMSANIEKQAVEILKQVPIVKEEFRMIILDILDNASL